ncbi:recombinase family protein [Acidisoma sp. L85]|uniref:recombinase family protein n=1 Tax=Acidisoma sp. L85 TaxID=1641850 RepID=UPI002110B3DC|nr:recombinase family protein [Acidisoma sp. L85]
MSGPLNSKRVKNLDQAIKAALYVRMSTDLQKYSAENQEIALIAYAASHGMEVVRTYADEGRSGLNLGGRDALQQLIADVESRRATFTVVLVYDVSRWGRFQDADESAYYEHLCKRYGVNIHYCAEQFENDGSMSSTLIKGLKRFMSGAYSQDLSKKVFLGSSRLISLGFRQGGVAGYGLRRLLVDEHLVPKGELLRGQRKHLQTDRVVLVPGPLIEVETVSRIYHLFTSGGLTESGIAGILNSEEVGRGDSAQWSRATVHEILTNEKYLGNNLYNRTSAKLKQKKTRNPPQDWVRATGAFTPLVDADMFSRAQSIVGRRTRRWTDDEMLTLLRALLDKAGRLSRVLIDEQKEMPSSTIYRRRFDGLANAYALIGYHTDRDYQYIEVKQRLRILHPTIISELIDGIHSSGSSIERDSGTDLLRINDEFTVSVAVMRCRTLANGGHRWNMKLDSRFPSDLTIAVRMAPGNLESRDFYFLPRWILGGGQLRLSEKNGLFLDALRFDHMSKLFDIAEHIPIRRQDDR